MLFRFATAACVGILGLLPVAARAQEAPVDFARDIQPIFARHCYACHGPSAAEGGLRLDQQASVLAPADSGLTPVRPGEAEESELLRRVAAEDESERMPPEGAPLAPAQLTRLRQWIREGAPWMGHWAFQPLRSPPVPQVDRAEWCRNPIDAFILSRLEDAGLQPAPPAERVDLLRRACYDLTGLPPTPEQVRAFLEDPGDDAYERVVDRLLQSPHYGERWGRHWLDLVRFAETNSFERDSVKPHAWRYRDYVIRSLNDDKPYSEFIREQLAGDELEDPSADAIIATGFYRLGLWDDEPADRALATYDAFDDIVSTTGQVFLGLTVNCGRCHDHKIDPITQRDYYSLLAFFRNIRPMAKKGPSIETPIPLDDGGSAAFALSVTEHGSQAPETFVLLRGNPRSPGESVGPAFPAVLETRLPEIPERPASAQTTGRRLALADWIASPDNRLTSRVMVNRIWQHHFGRGIVRSPNNFGQNGSPPTHPELLDWLAGQFVRDGWRLKPLHRLIMTSNAYRMSSEGDAAALAKDPANDLFWRFDMRRLSAEEVRDSLLSVSGSLNPARFGPGVYPELSAEVLASQSRPGDGWGTSSAQEQCRRSIYIHVKRSLLTPLLAAYDLADPDSSCEARFQTTQPAQALAMLNGRFANQQAAAFADRLRREAGDDREAQIRHAIRLALCREPDAASVDRGLALMRSLQDEHGQDAQRALDYYCLFLLNTNEFLYLD